MGEVIKMIGITRYEDLMNQHDFYETKARETKSMIKKKILRHLAEDWKQKALNLTIAEAMR